MVFSGLILYKFVLSAFSVVALSFVAEHVSPKWAGILSGFPTGSAITLYFYGLENGLEFAGSSAIYNMIGLVAMQMFIFCFYLGGKSAYRHKIFVSICCGVSGYTVTVIFLSRLILGYSLASQHLQ